MEADPITPQGPTWRGASVLVVDDESPIRQMIRRKLEAEGFQVEEAEDGESALRLIQSRIKPFDLVLTDLTLPEIDGRQVVETLRRHRPGVAVICMSAYPQALPPIDPSDTPVPLLVKPFSADELYAAIRREISRATDLMAVAEDESESVDLITVARELRALAAAHHSPTPESG